MLNQKVADIINDQINKELYSAYLYLDFSYYYYDEGLSGYGNWYFIQAQEERDHAMLMLEYLRNNGMPVTLKAIAEIRSRTRDLRHFSDSQHLRGMRERKRFPHDAVPRLVRKRTGRRRRYRGDKSQEVPVIRLRPERTLCAGCRAWRESLYRTFSDTVASR